jgi:hypothetical protein
LTLVAEATGREILRARQVMSELATEDRALREAVLLANGGLLGEAARVLREDLIERPSSEGFLLLGAIDLDRKLPSSAIRSFHTALALASEGPPSREPDISRLAREGIEAAKLSLSSPRDP